MKGEKREWVLLGRIGRERLNISEEKEGPGVGKEVTRRGDNMTIHGYPSGLMQGHNIF